MSPGLASFSLFDDLSGDELRAVEEAMRPVTVDSGGFVFREGDPGDALYFLREGEAEVLSGGSFARVNLLKSGDVFGEMAVLDSLPRSASIRALSRLELFRLHSDEFFALFQRHPAMARRLLRRLTSRMRTITFQLQQELDALALSRKRLVDSYDSTITLLSRALDLRDNETEGHSLRVTTSACELARKLGMPDEEITSLRIGALLHDVGKIGVPDAILRKPGRLNDEEWALMKQHAVWGYEMLKEIDFLREALPVILYHHEKFDGTGYPEGLSGERIPHGARIFAVVDAYDAITSVRPYKAARSRDEAIAELRRCAGSHFDPGIVEVFCS